MKILNKRMKIEDLFEVFNSDVVDAYKTRDTKAGVPCISGLGSNNGCVYKSPTKPIYEPNIITINSNGVSFLQPVAFNTVVKVILLRSYYENFNKYHGFYLLALINKNNAKYRGNIKTNIRRIKNDYIYVPCYENNEIAWEYMEEKIRYIYEDINEYKKEKINEKIDLCDREWNEYNVAELFDTRRGNGKNLYLLDKGNVPYISASIKNNGVASYVSEKNNKGGAITITADGIIGHGFFQEQDFYSSCNVCIIRPKNNNIFNKYSALFIITILQKEKYKYNYYRKFGVSKLNNTIIKLPADEKGNPDWLFMENYIKSLKYTKKL